MISAVCSPKRHGSSTKIGCNTANDMKLMRHHQQLVQLVISEDFIHRLKSMSVLSEGFWLAKHKHTNIPTMMEPFPPPAVWFCWLSTPHPREPLRKGLGKAAIEVIEQNQ
jgi:glucose-6-phosphate dehydrogenase assembly protein OpcA